MANETNKESDLNLIMEHIEDSDKYYFKDIDLLVALMDYFTAEKIEKIKEMEEKLEEDFND